MKFVVDGKTYSIEFARKFREIAVYQDDGAIAYTISTKFPDTIARVVSFNPNREVFREARVGCWNKEKQFKVETGRIRALRAITLSLPNSAFKKGLWDAYHSRYPK